MLIPAKQIIVQSFSLYKNNWKKFISYLGLFFATTLIFSLFSVWLVQFDNSEKIIFNTGFFIFCFIALAVSVFSTWISITFTRLIAKLSNNEIADADVKQNLSATVRLIIPVFILSIIVGLIIFGGLLLFIIPGIIFGVWYAFAMYEIVLNDKKIKESLHNSKLLVKGRWWSVVWRLLAPTIVFTFITLMLNYILVLPLGIISRLVTLDPNSFWMVTLDSTLQIASSIISVLILPLTITAPTILYLELRKTPVEENPTLQV